MDEQWRMPIIGDLVELIVIVGKLITIIGKPVLLTIIVLYILWRLETIAAAVRTRDYRKRGEKRR